MKKIILLILSVISLHALEFCEDKIEMEDILKDGSCPKGYVESVMKNWTIEKNSKKWSQQIDTRNFVCIKTVPETKNCIPKGSLSSEEEEALNEIITSYHSGTLESCFEIKQNFPKSQTGIYELKYKEMVYCDMEIDGGGWTLVDSYSTNSYYINQRTKSANLNPNQTKPTLLTNYKWSPSPEILCKSNLYSGSKPWLTLKVLSSDAKKYPTVANIIPVWDGRGHFEYGIMNGNKKQGLGTWIRVSEGRIGTIWIGNGSQPTCACGYTNNPTSSGLGKYGEAKGCSVWVR